MYSLDGSGVYRQDAILGPFEETTRWAGKKILVPQIEEIRAIRGADGEDYININDLDVMMNMMKFEPGFASLSVFLFVKVIIHKLLTARR